MMPSPCSTPACLSCKLFEGVRASYGEAVINSVREAAKENMDDALTLLDICLPELQAVLARQRQDYGLSEDFPAEYPVFQQAKNIDDTPVNNLAMERQSVDYRLEKLQTLPAVNRSVILGRAKELRDGKESNFRSFTQCVQPLPLLLLGHLLFLLRTCSKLLKGV